MMASWMAYVLLVSALFAGAAHVMELAMRSLGRSLRWAWAGAMAASTFLGLSALWPSGAALPQSPRAGSGPQLDGLIPVLEPVSQMVTLPDLLPNLDPWLLGAWIVLSVGVTLVILRATAALGSVRRGWKVETVNGRQVMVSEDFGPAVVGIRRPAIVLPRWTLTTARQDRELMIRHEEEHLAAGDAPLLFGALLLGAVLPWNLPIWWMCRRLRLAVEIDCDRRVLKEASSVRPYADLLVLMSRQTCPAALRGLGLARPTPFLEKRIIAMTTTSLRRPHFAFLFGPLAGLLIIWACSVDAPVSEAPGLSSDMAQQTAGWEADSLPQGWTVKVNPRRTVTIPLGLSAILTIPDSVRRVDVGNPEIADIAVIPPTHLMINGLTVGSVSLIIWAKMDSPVLLRIDVVEDEGDLDRERYMPGSTLPE